MFMEGLMGIPSRRLSDTPKKATNVSISAALLADAKELQIKLSRANDIAVSQSDCRIIAPTASITRPSERR